MLIGDIIYESILPSPYQLINDIINKLKNNENEFKYNKSDLKKLSDKDWKYFDQIEKLPDNFSLTIIRCDSFEYFEKFNVKPTKYASMEEIVNPKDEFDEHIWINDNDELNFNYDDGFKNLLKHELGHVWTFIFGALDDSFKNGQGPHQNYKLLNPNNFNHYQIDVFINLYNKNLKLLQQDYEYVLCKNDEESANYELSPHIDNIIEILIADYFECWINENTDIYLEYLWNRLTLKHEYSLSTLNLLKHYKENLLYSGYSKIESVKNPIRRLFLIFAFGTNEQIEYFKLACEDEFKKETKNVKEIR